MLGCKVVKEGVDGFQFFIWKCLGKQALDSVFQKRVASEQDVDTHGHGDDGVEDVPACDPDDGDANQHADGGPHVGDLVVAIGV